MKTINNKNRFSIRAEIRKVDLLGKDLFRLRFFAPEICMTARPGQFLFIRVSDESYMPFLRRAFAVSAVFPKTGEIDIIFRKVGIGTEILGRAVCGSLIDIIGPLGNSFTIPGVGKKALVVAGGCGIASLFFLCKRLKHMKIENHLVYGVASKESIVLVDELKKLCSPLTITTEDGSYGKKGVVTSFLHLNGIDYVYGCGPYAMLCEMAKRLNGFKGVVEFSLEPKMACGLGICQGCTVKILSETGKIKHSLCCTEGPVYRSGDIIWN